MSIQLNEEDGGKILVVQVSGKLTKADYERFVPEFDRLIEQHGKLRLLFDMSGFHGWEVSAVWEDIKVRLRAFRRHRTAGDGWGNPVAARHGHVLQTVYKSDDPIL